MLWHVQKVKAFLACRLLACTPLASTPPHSKDYTHRELFRNGIGSISAMCIENGHVIPGYPGTTVTRSLLSVLASTPCTHAFHMEAGPYLRLIAFCITQLYAQGHLGNVLRVIKKKKKREEEDDAFHMHADHSPGNGTG
jgi:hypothetical protein